MTVYKYFTKDSLIEAAKAGNERGYNRQLDPDKLDNLGWTEFLPVTFDMLHEHINGEAVEPHVRVMVMVDAKNSGKGHRDETVLLDISMERFNALPTYDSETKEDSGRPLVVPAGEGQHRQEAK